MHLLYRFLVYNRIVALWLFIYGIRHITPIIPANLLLKHIFQVQLQSSFTTIIIKKCEINDNICSSRLVITNLFKTERGTNRHIIIPRNLFLCKS